MNKKLIVISVLFLLVLQPFVLAEPEEADECGFFCKAQAFFSDFFGSRENIAAQASCSGFWQCFWGRGNVAGGAVISTVPVTSNENIIQIVKTPDNHYFRLRKVSSPGGTYGVNIEFAESINGPWGTPNKWEDEFGGSGGRQIKSADDQVKYRLILNQGKIERIGAASVSAEAYTPALASGALYNPQSNLEQQTIPFTAETIPIANLRDAPVFINTASGDTNEGLMVAVDSQTNAYYKIDIGGKTATKLNLADPTVEELVTKIKGKAGVFNNGVYEASEEDNAFGIGSKSALNVKALRVATAPPAVTPTPPASTSSGGTVLPAAPSPTLAATTIITAPDVIDKASVENKENIPKTITVDGVVYTFASYSAKTAMDPEHLTYQNTDSGTSGVLLVDPTTLRISTFNGQPVTGLIPLEQAKFTAAGTKFLQTRTLANVFKDINAKGTTGELPEHIYIIGNTLVPAPGYDWVDGKFEVKKLDEGATASGISYQTDKYARPTSLTTNERGVSIEIEKDGVKKKQIVWIEYPNTPCTDSSKGNCGKVYDSSGTIISGLEYHKTATESGFLASGLLNSVPSSGSPTVFSTLNEDRITSAKTAIAAGNSPDAVAGITNTEVAAAYAQLADDAVNRPKPVTDALLKAKSLPPPTDSTQASRNYFLAASYLEETNPAKAVEYYTHAIELADTPEDAADYASYAAAIAPTDADKIFFAELAADNYIAAGKEEAANGNEKAASGYKEAATDVLARAITAVPEAERATLQTKLVELSKSPPPQAIAKLGATLTTQQLEEQLQAGTMKILSAEGATTYVVEDNIWGENGERKDFRAYEQQADGKWQIVQTTDTAKINAITKAEFQGRVPKEIYDLVKDNKVNWAGSTKDTINLGPGSNIVMKHNENGFTLIEVSGPSTPVPGSINLASSINRRRVALGTATVFSQSKEQIAAGEVSVPVDGDEADETYFIKQEDINSLLSNNKMILYEDEARTIEIGSLEGEDIKRDTKGNIIAGTLVYKEESFVDTTTRKSMNSDGQVERIEVEGLTGTVIYDGDENPLALKNDEGNGVTLLQDLKNNRVIGREIDVEGHTLSVLYLEDGSTQYNYNGRTETCSNGDFSCAAAVGNKPEVKLTDVRQAFNKRSEAERAKAALEPKFTAEKARVTQAEGKFQNSNGVLTQKQGEVTRLEGVKTSWDSFTHTTRDTIVGAYTGNDFGEKLTKFKEAYKLNTGKELTLEFTSTDADFKNAVDEIKAATIAKFQAATAARDRARTEVETAQEELQDAKTTFGETSVKYNEAEAALIAAQKEAGEFEKGTVDDEAIKAAGDTGTSRTKESGSEIFGAIQGALGSVRTYPALTNLLFGEDGLPWARDMDRLFAPLLGEQAFASAVCDAAFDFDIQPEGMAIVKTPTGQFQAIAKIEAERTKDKQPVFCTKKADSEEFYCNEGQVCSEGLCYLDENNDQFPDDRTPALGYLYKISWAVSAPQDVSQTPLIDETTGVAVSFNVFLDKNPAEGINYNEQDNLPLYRFAGNIQSPIELKNGDRDGDYIIKYSEALYNEACIKWKSAPSTVQFNDEGGDGYGLFFGFTEVKDVCMDIEVTERGTVTWDYLDEDYEEESQQQEQQSRTTSNVERTEW